jgi:hypothetical protein
MKTDFMGYRDLLSDLFPDQFPTDASPEEFELACSTLDGKRLALAIWDLANAPGPANRDILLAWYGIGPQYEGHPKAERRETASKLLRRPTDKTRDYVEMLVGQVRAYYQIGDNATIRQTRKFVRRTYGHRL